MPIVSTSGAWEVAVYEAGRAASLDDLSLSGEPTVSGTVSGGIDAALAQFDGPTSGEPYAATLTAEITLDSAEDIGFYLFAAGHARIYIDGVLAGDVTVADQPGAGAGPCPANGGAVCLCQADNTYAQEKIEASVSAGTHTITIEYLNLNPKESMNVEWAVGNIGRRDLDLSVPEARIDQDLDGGGEWGDLKDWPLLAIHAVVLDDGRVLTYGGKYGQADGFTYYDVYDPVTDTHVTYDNYSKVDTFCSAMIAIPGTSKVLVAGGDAIPAGGTTTPKPERGGSEYTTWTGITNVTVFDADTGELTPAPDGDMTYPRWYPTVVGLQTGQILIIGGRGGPAATIPEIYTYGEGWKTLPGANDTGMSGDNNYPRPFVRDDGTVIYFAGQDRIMVMDPTGEGSVEQVGTLPFNFVWSSPTTVFAAEKALIHDTGGNLWVMDYSDGNNIVFEQVASLGAARNWSNMTVLADGTVMINGGSRSGNTEAGQNNEAVIWDPRDNSLAFTGEDEDSPRLYHSTAFLLRDGSMMTSGGGAAGFSENSYLDGQIYRPAYLYDADGNPAERPEIVDAPFNANMGQTVVISLDDASDIARLTFAQTNAVTHAVQMSSGFHELSYRQISTTELEVTLPTVGEGMMPGNWMLFAWDTAGTPSMAPIVRVNPELEPGTPVDGNLLLNGSFEVGGVGLGTDPLGWDISGTIGRHESATRASDGTGYVPIDGWGSAGDGQISQTIATLPGQTYQLTFDIGKYLGTNGGQKLRIEALDGTLPDLDEVVDVDGDASVTFTFRATGTNTTIRFSDATPSGTGSYDLDLDNVKLVETEAAAPSISGRYFLDQDDSGTLSAGDGAVAGATVYLLRNGVEVAQATTDGAGLYDFTGVAAGGGYRLAFEAPKEATGTDLPYISTNVGGDEMRDSDVIWSNGAGRGHTHKFSVTAGDPLDGMNAGLLPMDAEPGPTPPPPTGGPTVTGTYFLDRDDNGVITGADTGVGAATVFLYRNGSEVARTTTADDGSYSFAGLDAGDGYRLAFENPIGAVGEDLDYVLANFGAEAIDSDVIWTNGAGNGHTHKFSLAADEVLSGMNAGLLASDAVPGPGPEPEPSGGSGVGGRYFIDRDGDGRYSSGDGTVGDATVVLLRNGSEVGRTTTADDGTYIFRNMEAGSGYRLAFEDPNDVLGNDLDYITTSFGPESTDSDVIWSNTAGDGHTHKFTLIDDHVLTGMNAGLDDFG